MCELSNPREELKVPESEYAERAEPVEPAAPAEPVVPAEELLDVFQRFQAKFLTLQTEDDETQREIALTTQEIADLETKCQEDAKSIKKQEDELTEQRRVLKRQRSTLTDKTTLLETKKNKKKKTSQRLQAIEKKCLEALNL